jgi:hypothetical protein
MIGLTYYFNEMSRFASEHEREGNTKEAQKTRDTRNNSWERGVRAEVRYHQAMRGIK